MYNIIEWYLWVYLVMVALNRMYGNYHHNHHIITSAPHYHHDYTDDKHTLPTKIPQPKLSKMSKNIFFSTL